MQQRRALSYLALPLAAVLVISSSAPLVYADPPDNKGNPPSQTNNGNKPAEPPGQANKDAPKGGGQANNPSNNGNQGGNQGNANNPGQGNQAKEEKAGKGSLALSIQNASSSDGRGSSAWGVNRGASVTFVGKVEGSPPGNSGKKGEVWMNIPHHLTATSFGSGTYDGNKVTWKDVTFTDGGSQTFSVTATVNQSAPCNHVATTVFHVNGLGSEQVQVRVQCPEGSGGADVSQPGGAPGSGSAEANTTRFTVIKTAEFEGQKLERIERKHLGKHITYNILVKRNGEPPKGRVQIVEDMLAMCGALKLDQIQTAVELYNRDNQRLRVGDDFTFNNCQLTILGDAKDGPGNDLHFKMKVLLAPTLEKVTTSVLTNRVRASVVGQNGAVVEQEGVAGVLGIAIAEDILPPAARVTPGAPSAPAQPGGLPSLISLPTPGAQPLPEAAAETAPAAADTSEVAAVEGVMPAQAAPAALPSAGGPALPIAGGLAGLGLAAFGWVLRRRLQ